MYIYTLTPVYLNFKIPFVSHRKFAQNNLTPYYNNNMLHNDQLCYNKFIKRGECIKI